MEENLKKESSKNQKSNKIVVILLSAVVLVCAVFAGLYASGILGVPTDTKPASEETVEKASNVTDEATLRELLLMNCELDIKVTEDMEITETLIVNGTKKVTSDNLLKASFKMEDGTAMLDVSKKASLTIDGWNLDGNGVALGVNVNRRATFNHLSGKMEYMGTYGVATTGITNLSEKTEISHTGEGAMHAQLEGEIYVEGGTYTDGGNYLANVEGGGLLKISGDALFDGAVRHLVYNYGETTINGGTFLNSGYRGIANYAKMTMDYTGEEDGYIEVAYCLNVPVYTYSMFKSAYRNVYVHDVGPNAFLSSSQKGRVSVEDCIFDTSTGNAMSLRGTVSLKNVEVKNAGSSGMIIQEGAQVTLENVNVENSAAAGMRIQQDSKVELNHVIVDTTGQRGINVLGSTVTGQNVTVKNAGTIGIIAEELDEVQSKVELSDVYLEGNSGNNVKVVSGSIMNFKDAIFKKSKRTNVYVEKGSLSLNNVEVLGTLDEAICTVQIQKEGVAEIAGKTLITGGTMRAVGIYGGKFTMNDGIIRDNNASETGAAVHITKVDDSAGNFRMNGGIICNNTTANEKKNAGGVNVSANAVFVMTGGEIYGNSTSNYGGGVRVDKGATFKMSGGSIYKNTANQGAGIFVDPTATVTISGGSIYQNEAKASGAGIYLAGTLNLSGGEIYQNVATSYGGAMNIVKKTVDKEEVYGTLNMTGGTIYGNSAALGGGGIQVSTGGIAKLSDGKVTNNETDGSGDGIRVSGDVTISDDFYLNGDVIALTTKDVVLRVTGEKLTKHSTNDPLLVAAANDVETGTVVVECDDNASAVSVLTQTASGNGSYLLAQKDNNLVVNYTVADMDMTGADTVYVSNFQQLKEAVENTTSKRYVIICADIEMEDIVRVPNGTTVYIRDDGVQRTLSRQEDKTTSFFHASYGTGLYLVGTKTGNLVLDGELSENAKASDVKSLVTAMGGTIVDGVIFKNNGSQENTSLTGAFIYQSFGSIELYDSTFTEAQGNSGAIALRQSTVGYAENCEFINNAVRNGGGAIQLRTNAEFKVKNCLFENNTAGTSGGVVDNNNGTFIAIDSDFKNNTAGNNGGVIKSQNGGTAKFIDEDGKVNYIVNNQSTNDGGAIWSSGTLVIDKYSLEKNTNTANSANGGAVYAEGETTIVTVTDSIFTENESKKSGGAIYNQSTLSVENTDFEKNIAVNNNGGAVYTKTGQATITNGTFKSNEATTVWKGGGAIYAAGTLTIDGTIFEENIGHQGGAISYEGRNNEIEMTITNATFEANEATVSVEGEKNRNGSGGAIYTKGGTIALDSTEFIDNSAADSKAEAIHVAEQNNKDVYGSATNCIFNSLEDPVIYVSNGEGSFKFDCCSFYDRSDSVDDYVAKHSTDAQDFEFLFGEEGADEDNNHYYIAEVVVDTYSELVDALKKITIEGIIYIADDIELEANISIASGANVTMKPYASAEKDTLYIYGDYSIINSGTLTIECNGNKKLIVDGRPDITADSVGKGNRLIQNNAGAVLTVGEGVTLQYGKRTDDGGALHNSGTAYLSCDFVNNEAYRAAAIHNATNAVLVITGGNYENNKALNGTNTKADGGVIRNVSASTSNSISGATFINNSAERNGGAIANDGSGYLAITDCGFEGNTCASTGGAIVNYTNATLSLEDTYFVDNINGTYEGITGIHNAGTISKFQNISSEKFINVSTYEELVAALNSITEKGLIYITKDIELEANITIASGTNVTIKPYASAEKDTLYIYGDYTIINSGTLTIGCNGNKKLIVDGRPDITADNVGKGNRLIQNNAGAVLTVGEGVTLQYGKRTDDGGALHNSGTAYLSCDFVNNEAYRAAAIHNATNAVLVITGGNYENNKALNGTNTKADGGVIRNVSASTSNSISGATFVNNSAERNGGAIANDGSGYLVISSCGFEGNTSASAGGAIVNYGSATIGIKDTYFVDNTKSEYSGITGIHNAGTISKFENVSTAKFTIASTYEELVAALDSITEKGLIYITKDIKLEANITIASGTNVTIKPYASVEKDALYIYGDYSIINSGTLAIECNGNKKLIVDGRPDITADNVGKGNRLIQNNAGAVLTVGEGVTLQYGKRTDDGGALHNSGTAYLSCDFVNNEAYRAAAIHNATNAVLVITGGNYENNKALNGTNTKADGGVIRNVSASTSNSISGATFVNNSAERNGGAIANDGSGYLVISSCGFEGNTSASAGGAIVNYGSATIGIKDTYFVDNTKSEYSGITGIYNGGTVSQFENVSTVKPE